MEFIYPWIAIFAGLMILSVLYGWASGLRGKYEVRRIKRYIEKQFTQTGRGSLEQR
jgi:hypothetical protein